MEPGSRLISDGFSLQRLGCLLAGQLARATAAEEGARGLQGILAQAWKQGSARLRAMHRPPKREAFPIRLGELEPLLELLRRGADMAPSLEAFCNKHAEDCWTLLSVWYCNSLHGCCHMKAELTAVLNLRASVRRMLTCDASCHQSLSVVKKELSSRYIGYTGDEVPKMEVLTLAQVAPALPPMGHGGTVNALDWVGGRTQVFLSNPDQCLLPDDGRVLPPLQAKVHIAAGEEDGIARALVDHGVCSWVELERVVCYRGQRVLNGLFGVPKPSKLANGLPCLRVIMNLVPLNSVMATLTGKVNQLPGISQYLSLVLGENESIHVSQLDMTSAFYLFSLPAQWRSYMSFNLIRDGSSLGLRAGTRYCLACAVLPMGWSSAVAIMQEISEALLAQQGFDQSLQVHRRKPLPTWLTEVLASSKHVSRAWYHVYLDNFMSGERNSREAFAGSDEALQKAAEQAWKSAGVLSSEKKKVVGEEAVEELGGFLSGDQKMLGVTALRLIKVLHTTWFVLQQSQPPVKWLQVVCGRWIHILQFRRAAMCTLQKVWQVIARNKATPAVRSRAKLELFQLMAASCLLHTHLGAQISPYATASDASGTGGAIGVSRGLTSEGTDFVHAASGHGPVKCSALVISLFNGIGGAFRAYDLCGVQPDGLISVDWCAAANRVTSRRWPQALLLQDVREVGEPEIRKWLFDHPHVTEVHLWAGFPCVDVSAVRAFRANLQGKDSGLYVEILRVKTLIHRVFGHDFPVYS